MKRAIAAKGRKGSPPLPRQRMALRLVQLTLVGIAVCLVWMAYQAGEADSYSKGVRFEEVVGLSIAALAFLLLAFWMGFRTVRGPQPPTLD
ncbi:MAG TPA: hypothetical protein VNA87_04915 [Actinomycetota bacterium]|nr:hypothetical protein [Actinomycetota bacterium]